MTPAKTAPLAIKKAKNIKNSLLTGGAYGYGRAEGGVEKHVIGTVAGIMGGYGGNVVRNNINKNVNLGFTSIGLKSVFDNSTSNTVSNLIENNISSIRKKQNN
ncbi:MAG: hypothetical protein LBL47_03500 [Lactobacillus sp.]|nr:hypothetical protein [Lactobacillus sp.]